MSAASYYDEAAAHDNQPGHSGTQIHGQDPHNSMHEQQQRGFPQQNYNRQNEQGTYDGQEPNMGNRNYVQGAQQMNGNGNYAQGAQQSEGHGAQAAVADDRDTLTKCNDNPPDYKKETTIMPPLNGPCFQCPGPCLCTLSLLLLTAAVQPSLI